MHRTKPRGPEPIEVSSTDAQNRFGYYLSEAARDRPVIITRREEPQAVLLSFDRYRELTGAESPAVERLRERFDALFDRMQTPESRAAVRKLYSATSEEMGRAAVEAARERSGRVG